jgi:ribulose-bisphosphate carboxylase large chain
LNEKDARAKAEDICTSRPWSFLRRKRDGVIRDHVFGRIESFGPWGADSYKAVISYAVEIAAGELSQLLNVIFGNSSIKPGIRVEHLDLPDALLKSYRGPRFGREGVRRLLKVPKRPLRPPR